MADIYSKTKRSEIMSLIRSKNTLPEREVFSYLRKHGVRFAKHYGGAPGKPDVAIPQRKVAVFIDGDFWHGWQFARWSGNLPNAYWRKKISANMKRDKKNFAKLRRRGWRVLRIWEHQLSTLAMKEETLSRLLEFLSH